jgi:hypothetical protein
LIRLSQNSRGQDQNAEIEPHSCGGYLERLRNDGHHDEVQYFLTLVIERQDKKTTNACLTVTVSIAGFLS